MLRVLKKLFSVLLSVIFVLTLLPMNSVSTALAQEKEIIVNVKDFGAVGDGKTNDQSAMVSAFKYAINNYASKSIPVTVYFPEGEYGLLRGGMYINLPAGSGNLTVKGVSADKSTIVYLDEWVNAGSWVAIRLQMESAPATMSDYLHDITIQDLGVYDTDPVKHAWSKDEGDPGTEETHGFNIQHCVRATIKNCKIDSVGDEALDMSDCIDSEMRDNLVINSPGAGSAGGGISVGDGCKNVRLTNNTILGSVDNPNKTNWAIAIEALAGHIEDIVVENNVIAGIHGYGINIGAPAGTVSKVSVQNNTISDCRDGGVRLSGSGQTNDVHLLNNTIRNSAYGIYLEGSNKDGTIIDNCTIDTLSSHGVRIDATSSNDTLVRNSVIRNVQNRAVYNAGTNTKIDHVLIDGVGLKGGVTAGAITQYVPSGTTTSSSEVSNTVILNCQNKKGLQGVQKVVNTRIDQVEASGYVSITGASYIQNCKVNRIVQVKSGSTVDGLVLYTEVDLGTHAIVLSGLKNCTIKNCVLTMPSRYGISESGTANNNVITDNVTIGGSGIKTVGADTVLSGNIRTTLAKTEQFAYRVVDGKVTILEWLDKTATEVTIPAAIEEYPVVGIDAWAFALCADLTTITIPNSIAIIGANAFYMCDALANVNYSGSKADWDAIAISENNDALVAAWYNAAALYSDTVRHSVMDTDNGNGLAFRFELHASGVKTVSGNRVNLANATVNYFGTDCKLIGMGAVVTNDMVVGEGVLTLEAVNGTKVVDVPTVYLQEVSEDSCAFATRIINIPDSAMSRKLYARPYCIIEVDGEQITVYGDIDSAFCAEYM